MNPSRFSTEDLVGMLALASLLCAIVGGAWSARARLRPLFSDRHWGLVLRGSAIVACSLLLLLTDAMENPEMFIYGRF